ncbi:tetratricopeptide repeat protein [Nonomuraea jabiensis]|uniref:tetratricopeptide repeat protein n=1 Tax=Nonomuraea jabiensis TaxID=882448 RepID=UPI003682ADBA
MVTSGTNGQQETPGPYPGSCVFRTEDRHRFFGRAEESGEVRKLWQAQQVTVLYGPSGIGKTSLVQAGVMPLLSPSVTDVLPLGRVSYASTFPRAALPSHNPFVLALLMSWSPPTSPTRLVGMTIPGFLRSRPIKRDAYGDPMPILMAVDQVEELFTAGRRHQLYRDWFFGQLSEALRANTGLRLLLSIRADRLTELLPYERQLAASGRTAQSPETQGAGEPERFPLEALTIAGALEAVTRPLHGTGRAFAKDAAQQLVGDLSKVSARSQRARRVEPAQLQVVCEALWNSLPPDTTEISKGDVLQYADRALSEHYEREIRQIASERFNGDERRLRTWLRLTFTSRSGDRQAVPQSATRLASIGWNVVALLVKRRLLLADQSMGEGSYELAYDRMLRPVDREIQPTPQGRLGAEECLREAEAALREGDLLLAARLGEKALTRSDEHDLRLRARIESLLGNIAHEHGDLAESLAHYSTAAKSFETAGVAAAVGPLLTAIGRLQLAQGRPARAVRDLQAAMVRLPADLTIQTELAWALWHGGHPDAALGVLNGVLDREGNNTDALLTRGQILAGMGRADAALRDLGRAGPLRWPFAKVAHALALAQTNSLKEAQQEMVEALAESADHGPLLLYAARVEQLAGKTTSAVDLAAKAITAKEPALPEHMAEDAKRLVVGAG